jgi:AraC-like DNA-binding protein
MRWCFLGFIILLSLRGNCHEVVSRHFEGDTTGTDTTAVNAFIALSKKQKWIDPYLSLRYADRALVLAEKLRYKKGAGKAFNLRGFCFWSFGDNDLAIQAGLESMQIARDEADPLIEAESNYILARGYLDVADDTKARESINAAANLARKGNDWELLSSIYNLLGVVFFVENELDSALRYYTMALDLGKDHNVDPINFPRILSNIGECYANENPRLALSYFTKARAMATETGNSISEASINDILGHALLRQNELQKSETHLVTALAQARRLGLRRVVRHAYSGLVDIKLKQGKGEEAIVYLRKSYAVRDSLMNTAKIRQIVEMESKHELQLKEQNIRLLESEKRNQKLLTKLLVASIVFVVLVAAALSYLQMYKHRKNREMLNLEIDLLTQRQKEAEDRYRSAMVPEVEVESQDQKFLKKAITVVEANISDAGFNVDKMAVEMNMSRTNFHRKVKSITGFPPGELIRSIRLRKAARLISARVDSATQIAQLVGFDDYSHFSKSFKKHFGVSPTQYGTQLPAEYL